VELSMSMIVARFGKAPSVKVPSVRVPQPTFQTPIRF